MVVGGLSTWVWDAWLHRRIGRLRARLTRRRQQNSESAAEQNRPTNISDPITVEQGTGGPSSGLSRRNQGATSKENVTNIEAGSTATSAIPLTRDTEEIADQGTQVADTSTHAISVKVGVSLIVAFFG